MKKNIEKNYFLKFCCLIKNIKEKKIKLKLVEKIIDF